MPLKNIFTRNSEKAGSPNSSPTTPSFTFIRSDTSSQSIIHPPTGFPPEPEQPASPKSRRRSHSLRQSIHNLSHRRNRSVSSVNLPQNLPDVEVSGPDNEAGWEHRAAVLVGSTALQSPGLERPSARSRTSSIMSKEDDATIQEAIRLHEAGELERAAKAFGRLADPEGANNAIAQVLYGLSLRHGWGIEKDESKALIYLKEAAKNSAAVEEAAHQAGMKSGSAKGELVLAIFELGNCFRYGWGVDIDPQAAKEYYLTAANLGDSDAQNEVAWCLLEGFGCKKDKKKAAHFYRLAEKQGNKTLGNSWIYKDKYMDGD